jgi:hypothetical protein
MRVPFQAGQHLLVSAQAADPSALQQRSLHRSSGQCRERVPEDRTPPPCLEPSHQLRARGAAAGCADRGRTAREKTAKRIGWGDDVHELLASPIFREPLTEPGEPLFWAPLLALFAGLRMEEALQLRTDDFSSELGVAYINVWISEEHQRLKTESAQRQVPIHSTLLDLGLLHLVELRRSAGRGRIFTYLERGKNKGKLGEIFSKRFTHYRRRHKIYKAVQDFHGFRTEFQTRLTHARVAGHTRSYLMGHEITDITHKNYFRAGDPMTALRRLRSMSSRSTSTVHGSVDHFQTCARQAEPLGSGWSQWGKSSSLAVREPSSNHTSTGHDCYLYDLRPKRR